LKEDSTGLLQLCQKDVVNTDRCSFPCKGSLVESVDGILQYLKQSFKQLDWLQKTVQKHFPQAKIDVDTTTDSVIISLSEFGVVPNTSKRGVMDTCSSLEFSKLTAEIAWAITNSTYLPMVDPGTITGPTMGIDSKSKNCTIAIKVDPEPSDNLGAIIGGAVGGFMLLCLIAAILLLLIYKRPLDLSSLPPKARWQYEQYQANPGSWTKVQAGHSNPYYKKRIEPKGNEFENLKSLLEDYFYLDENLVPSEAYAIYNPSLISNFINSRKIMSSRFINDPSNFAKKDWLLEDDCDSKQVIVRKLESRLAEAGCMEKGEGVLLPILPCCHSTDFNIALAICSTGFSALSNSDSGEYGAGVYFTTYAMFATHYVSTRKDPAFIISFVTPGNPYPLTRPSPGVTKASYNCHYVAVTAEDKIPSGDLEEDQVKGLFDEIVVPQESQISPVYVIRFNPVALNEFISSYDRTRGRLPSRPKNRSSPTLKKTKSLKSALSANSSKLSAGGRRPSAVESGDVDSEFSLRDVETLKVPKKLFVVVVPVEDGKFEKINLSNSDSKTVQQLLLDITTKRSLDIDNFTISGKDGTPLDSLSIPLSDVPDRVLVLQPKL